MSLAAAALAAGLYGTLALPPSTDHGWHLMTVTEGGTVSLIKDLTKAECEFMKARTSIWGDPATIDERIRTFIVSENTTEACKKQAADHPTAAGAALPFGCTLGTISRMVSSGDIKRVECFR